MRKAAQKWGFRVDYHLAERMIDRNIGVARVVNTLLRGKRYRDPMYGSRIFYHDGLAITTTKDPKVLKTLYEGAVKKRWIPE